MNILAIETSCDDTGIAVLECRKGKLRLLSNVVSSQIKLHAPYGGVVPNLAARGHLENIKPCLETALKEAGGRAKIDLIAVTTGPGLIPSLLIGTNFAKALSYAWQKPIIGINHIEGHIYANWLNPRDSSPSAQNDILFPALCLIVSGGHTQLVLIKGHSKYQLLGQTRDDAAGEAFDKVAKLLGLGYPGGPIISKRAEKGDSRKFDLPRPIINTKDFDFSFSGLKTAVLYEVQKKYSKNIEKSTGLPRRPDPSGRGLLAMTNSMTNQYINDMAACFQQAVVDVLIHKTIKAAEKYHPKSIMLAGGVAANQELRKQLEEKIKKEMSDVQLLIPEPKFCTDNAAMIAAAACFKSAIQQPGNQPKKNQHWSKINADANPNPRSDL